MDFSALKMLHCVLKRKHSCAKGVQKFGYFWPSACLTSSAYDLVRGLC